jgi:predicted PurR-regulated permease PerM
MGGWRIALWAALVAFAFLYLVRSVLLPFVAALVISVLLDPTVRKLRLRGYPRWLAIGIVFVAFFGVLTGLGFWLTPVIGNQVRQFQVALEEYTSQFATASPRDNFFLRWNPAVQAEPPTPPSPVDTMIESVAPTLQRLGLPANKKDIIDQYVDPHRKDLAGYVENFFKGAFGLLPNLLILLLYAVITPLLVVYMLVDMDRLKRRGATWIPQQIRAETLELLRGIGQVFENYLRGVTIAILMYMAGAALVLTALRAPYSVLLGMLFGALYLIPYIGPFLSWTILFVATGLSGATSIYGITFDSSWTLATVTLGGYALYDRSFDLFAFPRIVGRSVGLNPIVSLFVVFAGGALFGLAGMLLAFPLAGAVKVVLDRLIRFTSTPSESLGLPAVPIRHRASS